MGTSLGVVIPKAILNAYGIQRGDAVLFICDDERGPQMVRIDPALWDKLKQGSIQLN